MTSSVIGLTGFMRTGKDSVALLLQSYGYQKLAFADPLREMALGIDPYISLAGVPEASFNIVTDMTEATGFRTIARYSKLLEVVGYERAKTVPDFRRFLQRLGTEGVRDVLGQSTWVDIAQARAKEITRGGGRAVFSDVRFPNEAAAIREMGGVVWRTARPGFGGSGHASETELEKIVPDVVLRADNLKVLGARVLEELGVLIDLPLLESWSSSVLGPVNA